MKKIDLLYFDAGGGHRSAANALKEVIERQNRPWQVSLVNIQETLDELDIFRKYLGVRLEDCYNFILNKGWTLGSPMLTRLLHSGRIGGGGQQPNYSPSLRPSPVRLGQSQI